MPSSRESAAERFGCRRPIVRRGDRSELVRDAETEKAELAKVPAGREDERQNRGDRAVAALRREQPQPAVERDLVEPRLTPFRGREWVLGGRGELAPLSPHLFQSAKRLDLQYVPAHRPGREYYGPRMPDRPVASSTHPLLRSSFRRAVGAARWLGLDRVEELGPRVVVLSPHLDDAIFSLGAAIASAGKRSAVSVVTVFAGDPESDEPAGVWDARAGFRTAGEAARRRRAEDQLACADVGARPVWLPFPDHQYARGADDELVWSAVEEAIAGAETILVPAFPLQHDDHVRLRELVERHGVPNRRLGLYIEQPYAAAWTSERPEGSWLPAAAALPQRLAKLRACRRYASQLPLLRRGGDVFLPLLRYELARGGELVRWE